MPPSAPTLDSAQVRTIRLAAQGMALAPGMPPAHVVARVGWLRTLGGADAYLALHARQNRIARGLIDTQVQHGELRVVPAVRGCIYLAPKTDVALCLSIAESMSSARAAREHDKAGIKKGEIAKLSDQVSTLLTTKGPMTTDALRRALPDGSIRSLGDAGKKVGISSPLPPALRALEFARRIERTPEDGRLDHERYLWRALGPSTPVAMPSDLPHLHAQLLERFVHFAGVATLPMFCAWSGLSRRDATAAVPFAAVDCVVADHQDAVCRTDSNDLLRMAPAVDGAVAFLSFEDNLVHLYGGPAHLVDDAHLDIEVPSWGASKSKAAPTHTLCTAPHLALRPLLADGCLSGFWEYDPDVGVAMPRCFRTPSREAQKKIEEHSFAVSAFLRTEIGHGRSFSLDTDDELRLRCKLLRSIGGDRVVVVPAPTRSKAPRMPSPTKPRATTQKPAAATVAKSKPAAGKLRKKPKD